MYIVEFLLSVLQSAVNCKYLYIHIHVFVNVQVHV